MIGNCAKEAVVKLREKDTTQRYRPIAGRAGHYDLPLMFISAFFLSPPNLGDRSADRHQTLPQFDGDPDL